MAFLDELTDLINRHSQENRSDTPDFILACYLEGCLRVWDTAIRARESWYGRKVPSSFSALPPAPPVTGTPADRP